MRRFCACISKRLGWYALAALLLMAGAGAARAQAPIVFDDIDWTLDRGNITFFGPVTGPNAIPFRLGRNNILAPGNNPGPAARRWVWPRTKDIALTNGNGGPIPTEIIDNFDQFDPLATANPPGNNYPDTAGNLTRVSPPPPAGNPAPPPPWPPQSIAHAYWNPNAAAWESPNFTVPFGGTNDYRAPGGGFSFDTDPTKPWNFDYGYVFAVHDDFTVTRPDGTSGPATADELAALPDTPPYVYKVVHQDLVASAATGPSAVYTSGIYNMTKGNYAIDIYSPGDGTIVPDAGGNLVVHPNVTRAFVRVSWKNTVNLDGTINFGSGAANAGGINDPVNSRIFMVDLGQSGWIHLQDRDFTFPAAFPFLYDPTLATPNPQDQIAITIYALTPDNLTDPLFGAPPLITSDAVRLIPQGTTIATPGGPLTLKDGTQINAVGRILGPVVGTDKLPANLLLPSNPPLYYVAREETVPDSTNRSFTDPTDGTSVPIPDPTGQASVPVFYCLDNRNSIDVNNANADIPSFQRVRWRMVGLPDGASGTESASPMIANVRCRDLVVRPMVFFLTTNSNGSLGHIYAFDPYGDTVAGTLVTRNYWTYPSNHPLTAAELATGNFPAQYHDPNYTGYNVGLFPAPATWFAADQAVTTFGGGQKFYYDGDIIPNPSGASPQFIVRSDTQLNFPGIQSSPLIMDDPSNVNGPQILVVGGMNGRVYAFDAGGRGDFDPLNTFGGTTQRIWTWPHFGADAYHLLFTNFAVQANGIKNEPSKVSFGASPSYDPSYPGLTTATKPVLIGAGDGHMYAINPVHDQFLSVINSIPNFAQRINWLYPDSTSSLGAPLSTAAIFQGAAAAKYVYFTSGGRVYNLPLVPPLAAIGNPKVNLLTWVYPFTPNPPNPDPTDDTTAALDPGFNSSAPLMLDAATAGTTYDGCYVVQGNGTVLALDASPTPGGATLGHTIVQASGQSLTGGSTVCSPLGTLITNQPGLGATPNAAPTNGPVVVFADNDGTIWSLNTVPIATANGPIGTSLLLPVAWAHFDSGASRSAAAILAGGDQFTFTGATLLPPNGMIIEGDEAGQLRAYGVGTNPATGTPGSGNTLGTSEPPESGYGDNSAINIDLRVLDFYHFTDWQYFMLTGTDPNIALAETPGVNQTGGPFAHTAQPLPDGQIAAGSSAIAVDWGDYLYISAWGVYHAQPTDGSAGNNSAPNIQVTFTVTQQTGVSRQYTVTVPPVTNNATGAPHTGALLWPDDLALDNAGGVSNPTGPEHNGLDIFAMDPGDASPNAKTGAAQNTFPWVAKFKIPIRPDIRTPFTPGSATYRVSARAVMRQSVTIGTTTSQLVQVSNILSVHDPNAVAGMSNGTFVNQNPGFTANVPRKVFVTNPIALTVRGFNAANMTGLPNVIGWAGPVTGLTAPGIDEVLGNGNRVANPVSGGLTLKALFAPGGMIQDGASQNYYGLDAGGNQQPALYAMDRSNLFQMTGRALAVRILTRPLRWHGDVTSVMNPLPWDQLPTDDQDTIDYPNIPIDDLSITTSKGIDAHNAQVPLTPPNYPDTNPADRIPQPTQFNLTVHVPRYQPANVNRGQVTFNSQTFGSNYTDISGTVQNSLLGPMQNTNGTPLALGDARAFPAGGYLSDMIVEASPPGIPIGIPNTLDNFIADSRSGDLTSSIRQAYRAFELGVTVPPTTKMRVSEQTIDLGKLPHGTGYSDLVAGGYRVPFAPTGTIDYLTGVSPWDDDTRAGSLGEFFHPFTLINESNVNFYDLRIAKLLGIDGAAINSGTLASSAPPGTAATARLLSDQVDILSIPGIFATPYGGPGYGNTEGNVGIVSSFDHISANANLGGTKLYFNEHSVWQNNTTAGLTNPYVINSAGFNTLPQPAITGAAWSDGLQPQPTLHKPRIGDPQGTVATIPDLPHDAGSTDTNWNAGLLFGPPKVSAAIPIGTPVGTYTNPIYAYEDNTPIQWAEWLNSSGTGAVTGANRDAILNVNQNSGSPIEAHADPTFNLKLTVREARLTGGASAGTLAEIDPLNAGFFSGNMLPAAVSIRDTTANSQNIFLYWTTNRQPAGSPYLTTFNGVPTPVQDAPWSLAYTELPQPFNSQLNSYDFAFARPGSGALTTDASWWGFSDGTPYTLFPGYTAAGQPANLAALFPSVPGGGSPALAGTPTPQTVRHASPAVAFNVFDPTDPETYLFWQGAVDKPNATAGGQTLQTDTRTFYTSLNGTGTAPGVPSGTVLSFLNDPALTKLAPKPLLLKLPARNGAPAQKLLYLLYYAGSRSQTGIYYNANLADSGGVFQTAGWAVLGDRKLPAPSALVWQSDPTAVYRQVMVNGQLTDVIDVVYTGVLKNRQTVETLLSRYQIHRTQPTANDPPIGALSLLPLPFVMQETLGRVGATNSWAARDAGWLQIDDSVPALVPDKITLYVVKNGTTVPVVLNPRAGGSVQNGKLDPASGLIYYDSSLGGQVVVDTRSGTVTFPNVPPGKDDAVLASYVPQVMRLNTTRDETNIVRDATFTGSAWNGDPAFTPSPAVTSPGSNLNPITLLDRATNPRAQLTAPQVVFPQGSTPPIDRLWVLYRKTDPSGSVKSTIYYKAMRLLVRLPRPVALTNPDANGNQQIVALTVAGNNGPYEVDWIRGRIYFTEADEGSPITVNYTYIDANGNQAQSGNLDYMVTWGDEISATGASGGKLDPTTPEVVMPTDSAVNEGQVTAFLDPFVDKLWVFWSSTRTNATDLFYQTLAPQLYPVASNQK